MGRAGFYQCLVTRMITKALVAVAAGAALLAALVSANGIHDAKGNIIKGLAESELIMGRSGKLGDTPPSIEYWANKVPATRGPPPVPFHSQVHHQGRARRGQDQRP